MQLHRLCVTNLTLSSRGGDSSVGRTGPTEKPGAMLTWVRVPVRQGIFLPESAPSADSLSYLSVQAHCAIACINICTRVSNTTHWQPYHCLDTRKLILHTLIGMGGAALLRLLCCTQGLEPTPWLFCRTLYQLNCSRPILL